MLQNIDNTDLVETISLALNPFIQFYQKKIPVYESVNTEHGELNLLEVLLNLEVLSSRKLTGNAAIEYLREQLSKLSTEDAKVVEKVITKDLVCGVNVATVNKIWPQLIPEYPCMLASPYEDKLINKIEFPALAQLKLDGMRFNAIVKNGSVEFRSRNGKEIGISNTKFERVFVELSLVLGWSDVVFDGELLVEDELGFFLDRKTGNGILNKAVKGTMSLAEASRVRAILWDYIPLANFKEGCYDVPYQVRFNELSRAIVYKSGARLVKVVETTVVPNLESAQGVFAGYLEDGQEGIILKSPDMIWENKRSKKQIKFKGELECDLQCVAWQEGTGKNTGRLGALVLESSDGKIRVGVGTGFSDQQRDTILPGDVIGKIVAVKYNAKINDRNSDVWSLFLPVFIEIREDKVTPDSFEDIK